MQMNKNLLILGAGQYGQVAKEIAKDMGCFEKISFLDDRCDETLERNELIIGNLCDYKKFVTEYSRLLQWGLLNCGLNILKNYKTSSALRWKRLSVRKRMCHSRLRSCVDAS